MRPGYDLQSGVCRPRQPEVTGSESSLLAPPYPSAGVYLSSYSCTGICPSAVPWATVGSIYNSFDLVPVHGTAPGGEAFMPVWGYQANQCGDPGVGPICQGGSNNGDNCNASADCPGGTCTSVGICQGGSNGGGTCFSRADCAGTCGPLTTGQCQGGTRDGLICSDAGDCPGGICTPMGFCSGHGALCQSDADCAGLCVPVGRCSTDGRICTRDADCPGGDCAPIRTWAGCTPDPYTFCNGIQDSDEENFDYGVCKNSAGCGNNDCVSDFTSAWPFLDPGSTICKVGGISGNDSDPTRIDFPNNVIVYRGQIYWEDWTPPLGGDDDYTMDLLSPGHELYDTDTEFAYHEKCTDETHGRVHVEFNSEDSINHFTNDDWGAKRMVGRAALFTR